jgi:hypothetical protein
MTKLDTTMSNAQLSRRQINKITFFTQVEYDEIRQTDRRIEIARLYMYTAAQKAPVHERRHVLFQERSIFQE